MMMQDLNLRSAAVNIIECSLGLGSNQNLLIIADRDSLDVADVLTEAAHELGIFATTLYVPRLLQLEFNEADPLPHHIEQAIQEADAVVSCLSDRAEHTAYRAKVIQISCGPRRKTAHAPGMTLDILRMAAVDYAAVERRCQLLAAALVWGREIEIVTTDRQGVGHSLWAKSGGWEVPPGISNGVIAEGEWANLPPGETFVVPGDGNGEIVINGSIPGRVLGSEDELLLRFEGRRLVDMQPVDSPAGMTLYKQHFVPAEHSNDPNWRNLAEIGFGTNPVITRLTGVELIDEKMAGTVHVALGRSDLLGGDVYATIHCDLVTERATVRIDGRPILINGNWVMVESDWVPDYRTVTVPVGWWQTITHVLRRGNRAVIVDGHLIREWGSGSGRKSSMPVGTPATSSLAAKVYPLLPDRAKWTARLDLHNMIVPAIADAEHLPGLFWVMRMYDLVRFQGEQL